MPDLSDFRFDVSFSFAGVHRDKVRAIAELVSAALDPGIMQRIKGRVFFDEWFRAEILSSVTFPCVMVTVLSQTTSIVLPGLFLSSSSGAEDIIAFLRLIAIIVTGPFIILIIVFVIKDKPEIPPSKSAKAEKNIVG